MFLFNNLHHLCMNKKKKPSLAMEILKAARRMSRNEEIAAHGHPVLYSRVERSKKTYTRKIKHKGEKMNRVFL